MISEMSQTQQSPQKQNIIAEILQDCATYDSLQTQVNLSQQQIQDQLTAIAQNSQTMMATPPLAQPNENQSPSLTEAMPSPQRRNPSKYTKLNFAGEADDPMYDSSSNAS